MARKNAGDSAHGFNDVIGLVLMGVSVLLLAALLSYNPRDLPANAVPPNQPIHNWIGPFGAHLGYWSFLVIGGAAYELPALLLLVGLGCFFEAFAYLRRRWPWAVLLLACCMGLLDLYRDYLGMLERNLSITAGGILGSGLNYYLFHNFGTPGATIIYIMVAFISVLYLTNFRLGEWVRRLWAARPKPGASPDETALEKRAAELQKQKKALEDEVARSGLGADLKPVPEPTVRDLSVPQAKGGRPKKAAAGEPGKETAPADAVEVIPAREIEAATTGDILGHKPEAEKSAGNGKPVEPPVESATADKTVAEAKAGAGGASLPAEAPAQVPVAPAPKAKPVPKKPKPITVASTPLIGNYNFPPWSFCRRPTPRCVRRNRRKS